VRHQISGSTVLKSHCV